MSLRPFCICMFCVKCEVYFRKKILLGGAHCAPTQGTATKHKQAGVTAPGALVFFSPSTHTDTKGEQRTHVSLSSLTAGRRVSLEKIAASCACPPPLSPSSNAAPPTTAGAATPVLVTVAKHDGSGARQKTTQTAHPQQHGETARESSHRLEES